MLYFSNATSSFKRIGLGIAIAQLSVFIAGFPPFQSGVWLQTEPTMFAVFLLAGLTALWIAYGLLKRQLAVRALHPLWLVPLAWVGWQFVPMLFSELPWRAWFGPPQQGEGVAWWVAWLLCLLLMHSLWEEKNDRHILLAAAAFILTLLGALHGLLRPQADESVDFWQPAAWADYLVFMMGYVWLTFMATDLAKNARLLFALVVVSFLTLYLSDNNTGIIIFLPVIAFTVLMHTNTRLQSLLRTEHWRYVAALAAVLMPLLWMAFCHYYPMNHQAADDASVLSEIASEKQGGFGSRLALVEIGLNAVAHEPEKLLAGRGWGNSSDIVFSYGLLDDIRTVGQGYWKTSWPLINGEIYHIHNQPLEALLALGIFGMVLWLLLMASVLWYLPGHYFWRCAPMLLGLCGLSCLWFQLPQLIAFHALAWAALMHLCLAEHATPKPLPKAAYLFLAVSVAMLWSAHTQRTVMRESDTLYAGLNGGQPTPDYAALLANDIHRGGDRTRTMSINYTFDLIVNSKKEPATATQAEWMRALLQSADEGLLQTHASHSRAAFLSMWMRFRILADIDGNGFPALRREVSASLVDSILEVAKRAPLRDDMATIFLINIQDFTGGNVEKQIDILQKILAIAPNHRPALWLMGGLLATHPETHATGIQMQKQALELGAARIYPISFEEIQSVEKSAADK